MIPFHLSRSCYITNGCLPCGGPRQSPKGWLERKSARPLPLGCLRFRLCQPGFPIGSHRGKSALSFPLLSVSWQPSVCFQPLPWRCGALDLPPRDC